MGLTKAFIVQGQICSQKIFQHLALLYNANLMSSIASELNSFLLSWLSDVIRSETSVNT